MARPSPYFQKAEDNYFFEEIERKVKHAKLLHPQARWLNLGIGDISLPLAPSVAHALERAAHEMTTEEGKRGYGPAEGYAFLREAIQKNLYASLSISSDEIFVSEGANNDTVGLQELFHPRTRVGIIDPTYPAYHDACILNGRSENTTLLTSTIPPAFPLDLVYICTPNNPTGVALTRQELTAWIDYAQRMEAVLIIDAAYAAFIRSKDVPRSIYELPGAHEVAVECQSFSKSAGFTGVRCAFCVVPKAIKLKNASLHALWSRRQNAKTNGVSYPIQRAAEATLSGTGLEETRAQVTYYIESTELMRTGLESLGHTVMGGVDSPYIFCRVPQGKTSWEWFQELLDQHQLIALPGRGFGPGGEGFVRFSGFTRKEVVREALARLQGTHPGKHLPGSFPKGEVPAALSS